MGSMGKESGIHVRRDYHKGMDAESFALSVANHLKYTLAKDPKTATVHDQYWSVARSVCDRLVDRWMEGDPNLVTSYALVVLSYCRPRDAK